MADRNEFESIALEHLETVYRAAVALCGNRQDAEDLVQTTFLKALERFDSFKAGTNCKAWLLQVLRNNWIDKLRRQKFIGRTFTLEEEVIAESPHRDETVWSNAQDLLENFSDQQVIKALSQLPDEQRLTLFLIDVEQFSQEQVAEITDVAVGTVKSRTSRARTALKKKLISYAKQMRLMGGEK